MTREQMIDEAVRRVLSLGVRYADKVAMQMRCVGLVEDYPEIRDDIRAEFRRIAQDNAA